MADKRIDLHLLDLEEVCGDVVEVAVSLVVSVAGAVATQAGRFLDIIHQETEQLPLDLASRGIVSVATVAVGADPSLLDLLDNRDLLDTLDHIDRLEEGTDAWGASGRHLR